MTKTNQDFDIWVDFRQVRRDGTVTAPRLFASKPNRIRKGHTVMTGDQQGHRCKATVLDVTADSVILDLDVMNFKNPGE